MENAIPEKSSNGDKSGNTTFSGTLPDGSTYHHVVKQDGTTIENSTTRFGRDQPRIKRPRKLGM
jgi:hypothetical protein